MADAGFLPVTPWNYADLVRVKGMPLVGTVETVEQLSMANDSADDGAHCSLLSFHTSRQSLANVLRHTIELVLEGRMTAASGSRSLTESIGLPSVFLKLKF